MTVTMTKKYGMEDAAYRQAAEVYRKKVAEDPANKKKSDRAKVIIADKQIIKDLPKMDVIKKDFFVTEEEARRFLKIEGDKKEEVSVKADDKTDDKKSAEEEKYSLKDIEKFKEAVLADAEKIKKDPALINKIRADLAKMEKENKAKYAQLREDLLLTPANFLFKKEKISPVPDYDNAVEEWLAETISTGNKKVTTAEINELFKFKTNTTTEDKEEQAKSRTTTIGELKKFLINKAGWRKEAVAILFNGESDDTEIALKDFKDVIYKNVKKFNDRCNDTEYLRALGIYDGKDDEKYIGKKYQEYTYFYKYNHQEAKDAVLKIQDRKDNPAGLNKILKRFKSFDGDVNNWSAAEIDLAYVYLSLHKEYALDDELEIIENTRNVSYLKFCRAYGLDQKEGVSETEKDDPPTTAKKVDGVLTAYTGDEKELSDNQKYIRWWDYRDDHSKLTKDDNFVIRRVAKNKKGQVVGFPETGLGAVDVKYLWIKNGGGWSVKGSKYLEAVVKVNGKYYECIIRDNANKADVKKTRYKNLSKKESEPIK